VQTRAQTIKARRIKLGLTQQEAADICGIKLTTWQKWEQDINDVSDLLWVKASKALEEKEHEHA
jgi:transcriptional regulator with XRE-family HTH domain